jgi:hypothetical protein
MAEDTNTFTEKISGKNVDFLVKTPTLGDMEEASKVRNRAFTDAINSKALLRAKLDDILKEQGLWNDAKQAELTSLQQELISGERQLAKGGMRLADAKKLAISMRRVRVKMQELLSIRNNLDNNTAEGLADNARFNYLVSACLVYKEDRKLYFVDLTDYLNRSTDPVGIQGAQILASAMYGLDSDFESKLPENIFLKDFKLIDNKLRLINSSGELVDEEGRLIDTIGRFIDDKGNRVDIDGNPLNEDGTYAFERKPFLDDDGEPIILEKETISKPKRRRITNK